MTRIEHVSMWSEDIEKFAAFYVHYFGATDRILHNVKFHLFRPLQIARDS
jgi:hypothetical protein